MGMGPSYSMTLSDATREFLENEKQLRQKHADENKRKNNAIALQRKPIPVKRDPLRA